MIQRHERSPHQPDIQPGFYVFRDSESPTHAVRHAVAGPFDSALAARLWVLQHLEAALTEPQRETWAKLAQRIGGLTHDLGVELFLLEWVAKGKSFERLVRYVPRGVRRPVDHRMAAAGDAA